MKIAFVCFVFSWLLMFCGWCWGALATFKLIDKYPASIYPKLFLMAISFGLVWVLSELKTLRRAYNDMKLRLSFPSISSHRNLRSVRDTQGPLP